jgi:hypothetical protein
MEYHGKYAKTNRGGKISVAAENTVLPVLLS